MSAKAPERIEVALRPLVRPIARLRPDPDNARVHDARNLEAIAASLKTFGQQKPIVVARDGRTVVAGSGTLLAARALGWRRLAVARTTLTPAQARAYGLADNRTAELAAWDKHSLPALLDGLRTSEAELLAKLWSPVELERLAVNEHATLDAEADDAPPVPVQAKTSPGIYGLGEHKLLCGDARKPELLAKVFEGLAKAEVYWTDPPYGVAYVGKTQAKLTIQGDSRRGLKELLLAAFAAADTVLNRGARLYIMAPDNTQELTIQAIREMGWRVHQGLVWVKDSIVLGHADHHYRHEPMLYGCCPLYRDRHQAVVYGNTGGKEVGRVGRGRHRGSRWYGGGHSADTVFEIPRPKRSLEHPTMKPVALVEAHVRNSSQPGDVVLDSFGGSGTTLVACHRLGRRAVLVEKDPRYCDVIRARYAKLVGDRAYLP